MQTELERHIDQQVGQLLVDYVALNDARRWPELASLFTADAQLVRPSAPDQPIIGREAILASFLARPADRRMRHVCANVQVTVLSATAAAATSTYVIYAGTLQGGDSLPVLDASPPVLCEFQDRLTLTAEGWRFTLRHGRPLFRMPPPPPRG
jgi:hypothetical protein